MTLRYDVPGTLGFAQKFYRRRDAGEFLVADLVLLRRSDPLLFREVELHGQGRTWFDRRGILVEAHLDAVRDMAQARARVPVLAASFAMFQHIVPKERLRGRAGGSTDASRGCRARGQAAGCRSIDGGPTATLPFPMGESGIAAGTGGHFQR